MVVLAILKEKKNGSTVWYAGHGFYFKNHKQTVSTIGFWQIFRWSIHWSLLFRDEQYIWLDNLFTHHGPDLQLIRRSLLLRFATHLEQRKCQERYHRQLSSKYVPKLSITINKLRTFWKRWLGKKWFIVILNSGGTILEGLWWKLTKY